MFFKRDNGTGKIDTVIGSLVEIKGMINSKASIRVDGTIEGGIESEGEVVLGKDAKIRGDIKAENILIGGQIEGNVKANEKVEILSSGELIGDIIAPTVVIDEGAVFTGTSKMSAKNKTTIIHQTIDNLHQVTDNKQKSLGNQK